MNKIIGIDVYSALHSPRGMGKKLFDISKNSKLFGDLYNEKI